MAPATEARAVWGPIAAPRVQVTWAMPLASVSDVAAPIEPHGRVQASMLPGGAAAVTWHVGPYDDLRAAYAALAAWLEASGREPLGAPWESYWSDPLLTPDQRDWRTEVLWPLP